MAEANKSKDKPVAQPSNADRLRVIYAAMEEFGRRLTALEKIAGIPGPRGEKGEAGAQGKQGDKGGGFWG